LAKAFITVAVNQSWFSPLYVERAQIGQGKTTSLWGDFPFTLGKDPVLIEP
jgi:hypothetical protein